MKDMVEKKRIIFEEEEDDLVTDAVCDFLIVLNGPETGNLDKRYDLLATKGQIFMAYLEILGPFSQIYGRRDYVPEKIFKEISGAKISCVVNDPDSLEIRANSENQAVLALKELGLPTDLSVKKDLNDKKYLK